MMVEKLILLLTQSNWLRRRLKSGWVAFQYGLRLPSPAVRVAQLERYCLVVNIAEAIGISSYFFRDPCVPWFLARLVGEGDCCLDIGSNMGHYAAYLASRVGPEGRVAAFEPQPLYGGLIAETILANRWEDRLTLVRDAAAADCRKQLKFFLSTNAHNSGVASLVNHGTWLAEDHVIAVDSITLDGWTAENQFGPVRFAKIDVERAEEFVLMGARGMLAKQAVAVWWIEMVTGSPAATIMQDAGYAGFGFSEPGGPAVPINAMLTGVTTDILFVPQSRIEGKRLTGNRLIVDASGLRGCKVTRA